MNINYPISTQSNELSYRTINYKNNKIPNKLMNQKLSSNIFNYILKNKNRDEDDTKNNQNFRIFMDNLFSKNEEINEISSIRSNKIFFEKQKMKNYNVIMNYNSKENYNIYKA